MKKHTACVFNLGNLGKTLILEPFSIVSIENIYFFCSHVWLPPLFPCNWSRPKTEGKTRKQQHQRLKESNKTLFKNYFKTEVCWWSASSSPGMGRGKMITWNFFINDESSRAFWGWWFLRVLWFRIHHN